MKRMLFNATQAEELRVAIVDGQKLIDLDIESATKEQRKSNIYKGVVTRVEPSLEACFVDYGTERHGFLPFKEIGRSHFRDPNADPARLRIQDAIKEGQELIVQIDKDERGNKGAALTTFVSLAGRYLVLMPNNPRGGGVSRRIEGEERNELRDTIAQLEIPQGMSIIARTAGIGRNVEELQWDLNYLLQLWQAIDGAASSQRDERGKVVNPAPFLIYQESSLVIRAIRDYFQPDIGEILIDTEAIYEQAQQFMSHVMPDNVHRVKLYHDDVPLFSRFQIEHQIETAYSREVPLPSGGAIVIDHTEALVSIDVNSARATRGGDIETTAFNTNCEAADELARQLRLRDLGGLIVIDFIDMESQKNQREVENTLRDALRYDRARIQLGKISRFGLMELSRQRMRPALAESAHIACPRCHGTGHIRGTDSTALHILRIIQEESMKDNSAQIVAQVPVDVATFLLNEKRADIQGLEARLKVNVVLVPNIHLETPNYSVTRLRHDDLNNSEPLPASYDMVAKPEEEDLAQKKVDDAKQPRQEAAVKGVTPSQPAPQQPVAAPVAQAAAATAPAPSHSLWRKFVSLFKGPEEPAAAPAAPVRAQGESRDSRNRRDQPRGNRRGRDDERRETKQGDGRERRSQEGRQQPRERLQPAQAEGAGAQQGSRRRDRTERGDRGERGDQQRTERDQPRSEQDRQDREPRSRDGNRQREPRPPKTQPNAVTASIEATPAALTDGERPAADKAPRRERGERRGRGERGADRGRGEGREQGPRPGRPERVAGYTVAGRASYDLAHGAPVRTTSIDHPAPRPPAEPRQPRHREDPQLSEASAKPAVLPSEAPAAIATAAAITSPPAAITSPPAAITAPAAPSTPPVAETAPPVPVQRAAVAAPAERVMAPPPAPEFKPFVLPSDSGLVMVETSASKVSSDGNAMQEEPAVPASGARRTRPPRPAIPDEPLVMVETAHKD